jgi:hypothetical protein
MQKQTRMIQIRFRLRRIRKHHKIASSELRFLLFICCQHVNIYLELLFEFIWFLEARAATLLDGELKWLKCRRGRRRNNQKMETSCFAASSFNYLVKIQWKSWRASRLLKTKLKPVTQSRQNWAKTELLINPTPVSPRYSLKRQSLFTRFQPNLSPTSSLPSVPLPQPFQLICSRSSNFPLFTQPNCL